MLSFATIVGFVAAVCTTIANIPQLYKCWTTGSAGDLSLYMLLVLASGLALWVAYGVMQQDYVVLVANLVSSCSSVSSSSSRSAKCFAPGARAKAARPRKRKTDEVCAPLQPQGPGP